MSQLGLDLSDKWDVFLEWTDPENFLCERTKSQIDAVARSKHSIIFFECKFQRKVKGSANSQAVNTAMGVTGTSM
jgi:hypothetical protein